MKKLFTYFILTGFVIMLAFPINLYAQGTQTKSQNNYQVKTQTQTQTQTKTQNQYQTKMQKQTQTQTKSQNRNQTGK
ncbi:MAG: hypothetical protein ACMUIM_10110 [bacterium]